MLQENKYQKSDELFDKELIKKRLDLAQNEPVDFISELVVEDLHQRLAAIKRDFQNAIIIGPNPKSFPPSSASATSPINFSYISTLSNNGKTKAINANNLTLPNKNYDLIISFLDLQIINDVPKYLKQIHAHLNPDGLMIAAYIGNETLNELRLSWLKADEEILGGSYARVAPFIDIKSAGNLLQSAGFALPVADIDHHIVRYSSALSLMKEIKTLCASNPLSQKPNEPISKTHLFLAAKYYEENFADDDGRIRATLDILWMSGWKPHESQQKPLARGSAQVSMSQIFKK